MLAQIGGETFDPDAIDLCIQWLSGLATGRFYPALTALVPIVVGILMLWFAIRWTIRAAGFGPRPPQRNPATDWDASILSGQGESHFMFGSGVSEAEKNRAMRNSRRRDHRPPRHRKTIKLGDSASNATIRQNMRRTRRRARRRH